MPPETRTVHFKLDPSLRAYLEYLDRTGRTFSLEGFDLFRANYRPKGTEEEAAPPAGAQEGEGGE